MSIVGQLEYHQAALVANGFTVIEDVLTGAEVESLLSVLEQVKNGDSSLFRKTDDLFAIRQFLKVAPQAKQFIFNTRLRELLSSLFGDEFFMVKSIYFDKPPRSNWFVACHQDLTISVKEKVETPGFSPWTVKQNQYAVQPPLDILEDNFTIRLHLDDTNADNGALKVIPGSHLKGICRPETVNREIEKEVFCNVRKGGVMIMKPLLLHASNRTVNQERRRVVHIEFSRKVLPGALQWSEKEDWY